VWTLPPCTWRAVIWRVRTTRRYTCSILGNHSHTAVMQLKVWIQCRQLPHSSRTHGFCTAAFASSLVLCRRCDAGVAWGNNTGIQLLRLRKDGFVALEAPYDFSGGSNRSDYPTFVTQPLRLPSNCSSGTPPTPAPTPSPSTTTSCGYEYPSNSSVPCPALLGAREVVVVHPLVSTPSPKILLLGAHHLPQWELAKPMRIVSRMLSMHQLC